MSFFCFLELVVRNRRCIHFALIFANLLHLFAYSAALKEDLALCGSFLEFDGRNFHCWAHRMWVAEMMALPAAEDFDFTTAKIMQARYWFSLMSLYSGDMRGRWFCHFSFTSSVIDGPMVRWRYKACVIWHQMSYPAVPFPPFSLPSLLAQNFSNYSAFHFRSKLVPRMVKEAGRDRWQLLQGELDLAHNVSPRVLGIFMLW